MVCFGFGVLPTPIPPPPLFVVESSGPGRGLVSADPLERGRERIGKGLQE